MAPVPHEKLEAVRKSEKLRPYLSHSKLKKLIREIHSNGNQKKRLWAQLEKDSDFRVFVDLMLQEMGYLDANN